MHTKIIIDFSKLYFRKIQKFYKYILKLNGNLTFDLCNIKKYNILQN